MGVLKAVFLFGFLLILFVFCGSEEGVVTIDVREARNLLNQGYLYLDVRTKEEFKNGHIESALNIPYMFSTPKGMVKNPKFIGHVMSLCSKEDHLIVGCKSGVRSANAIIDLLNAEFKNVYNMGGGHIAWIQNGFPVKKLHNEEL